MESHNQLKVQTLPILPQQNIENVVPFSGYFKPFTYDSIGITIDFEILTDTLLLYVCPGFGCSFCQKSRYDSIGSPFFVFIHPYPDGNGRMGRFLLNARLIAGGYPWTTIGVDSRNQYMTSTEKAVIKEDIVDFCNVIASELEAAKK